MEQKLAEAEDKVFGLCSDLTTVTDRLEKRHQEAEKMNKREQKYKELLGLSEDADQKVSYKHADIEPICGILISHFPR